MKRALRVALAASAGAWTLAWLAFPFHGFWRVAVLDVGWTVVGVLGALVAYTHAAPATRRSFAWLGAGAVAWSAGQAVWTWYELVGGHVPDPSLADVGFALSLPLFAVGLLAWPRERARWHRSTVLDGLILLAIVFAVGWEFLLSPLVTDAAVDAATLLNFAYPVGDIVLLAAIALMLTLDTVEERGRLAVVALGLFGLVVADMYFALAGEWYATGSAFDAGWTIGLAGAGAAAALPSRWCERVRVGSATVPLLALLSLSTVGGYQIAERSQLLPAIHVVDNVVSFTILMVVALGYVSIARARLGQSRALEELHRKLGRAYAQREAALESSRTGICLFDPAGELVFYNSAWNELLGPASQHGERWRDFVGSLVLDMAALADAGHAAAVQFRSSDERHLEATATALADGHVVVSVDDVTDQALQLGARDRFLARMVGARDVEARRVAEVLHEDVVQRLTALSLRLELRAVKAGDEESSGLAAEAAAMTEALRRLLVELHPVVLESQGLAAAVAVAAQPLRDTGIDVTVEGIDRRLPQPLEQLAYRLVQEALENILEHAGASTVKVVFSLGAQRLHCRIVDDGRGFDPQAIRESGHESLGLNLVRERLELAQGRFLLESRPGRGTVFGFDLPLETAPEGARTVEVAS